MSLAKGQFFVLNGLPPLEAGAMLIFTAGSSGPNFGFRDGFYGVKVQDTTGWAFDRVSVHASFGDLTVVSSLLAADVVTNGDGGRNLRIVGGSIDATIALSSMSLAGDTFTLLSTSYFFDSGTTYNVWVE